MFYKGKTYDLPGYFRERMKEDGFEPGINEVNGYFRSEAEYNAIAEYISSCDLSGKDLDFMESLGFTWRDFIKPCTWEVILSAGTVRNVICQTEDYREMLDTYEAYNNDDGCFVDGNGFAWDVYVDEWELNEN